MSPRAPSQNQPRKRKPSPRPDLELASLRVDPNTVLQLEELLKDARSGRIVGAVAAVHYGGREYAFVGSGSLCEDPRLGLHAVATLAKKMLP